MGFLENVANFTIYVAVPFMIGFIVLQPLGDTIVDIMPVKGQ